MNEHEFKELKELSEKIKELSEKIRLYSQKFVLPFYLKDELGNQIFINIVNNGILFS